MVKADLGVGQVAPHQLRQVAQADGSAPGIIDGILAPGHQGHADESLGDVLNMDGQAHHTPVGEADGFAARRQGYAAHMVGGAAHLVRPGDIGRPDARDGHPVVFVEHFGLEFVENLVDGVLADAVGGVVLGGGAVAEVGLLPADGHGAGIDDAVHAQQPAGFEAVVHPQDVEAHLVVGVALAAAQQIGQVDDAVGLRLHNGAGYLLKVGDVHPRAADGVVVNAGNMGQRVDVRGIDAFAALHQLADDPRPDEAGAAEYQNRHNGASCSGELIGIALESQS